MFCLAQLVPNPAYNLKFGPNVVFPRKTNDGSVKFFNNYYMVGIDMNNIKWVYDSEQMKAVWDEVVKIRASMSASLFLMIVSSSCIEEYSS